MKRVLIYLAMLLFVPAIALATEKVFELGTTIVTGLVYGPEAPWNSAIVNDRILIEGKTYWIEDGDIGSVISGERVMDRVPEEDRLSVVAVDSRGVTLSYRGETVIRPLKSKSE